MGAGQGDLRRNLLRSPADRPVLLPGPPAVLLRAVRDLACLHVRRVQCNAGLPRRARHVRPAPRGLERALPDRGAAASPLRVSRTDGLVRHGPVRVRHHHHPVRGLRGLRPGRQRPAHQPCGDLSRRRVGRSARCGQDQLAAGRRPPTAAQAGRRAARPARLGQVPGGPGRG